MLHVEYQATTHKKRSCERNFKGITDSCMGMFHDLEVWKITKQLQIQNSPEFDEFFIQFGQIHAILSVFHQ